MFTVDGKKASAFGVLPDGEYEVFITGSMVATANSGTKGIGMILTVRDDIDQQGGGRKVRHTVWVNENTEGIVQGFLKSLNFPDGQTFASLEEIADAVKALAVRVKLRTSKNNPDFNEVAYFKETNIGGFYDGEESEFTSSASKPANSQDPFQDDGKPIDISDDDLPF